MWGINTSHGEFEYETYREAVSGLGEFHLERFDDCPLIKSIRCFSLKHDRERYMPKSICKALQKKITSHIRARFREEKDEDSSLYREWVGLPVRYSYRLNPEYI